jgi:hypothetical protein
MVAPFVKIKSQTPDLDEVQLNIEKFSKQLINRPLVETNFISLVNLNSGDNLVAHGLGRKLITCFIGIPTTSTQAYIYQKNTFNGQTVDKTQYVCLNASAPVVVDIMVL